METRNPASDGAANPQCECIYWCRADIAQHGRRADGLPILTHHHPRCEHYNDSLIDVWRVSDGSSHYYDQNEEAAKSEADVCDGITIEKVQMHREVYEQLPEFGGF